jgi:hypothetical protein
MQLKVLCSGINRDDQPQQDKIFFNSSFHKVADYSQGKFKATSSDYLQETHWDIAVAPIWFPDIKIRHLCWFALMCMTLSYGPRIQHHQLGLTGITQRIMNKGGRSLLTATWGTSLYCWPEWAAEWGVR